jgi:hypothetical protein
MSRESMVFILGILTILTPFLGVPREYKDWLLIVMGSLLALLGYQLRRKRFLGSLEKEGERKTDAFAETSIDPKPPETSRTGGLAI